MDAAVTEPTSPTIRYTGKSIEERVSVIEGTIMNQNRIFDMLHEGQQNLRADITGLRVEMRDDMDKQFGEMRDDMGKRFGDVDKQFGEMRDDVDKRFGDVDKQFGEMRDDMGKRFGDVDKQFGEMRDDVDKRFGAMSKQFGASDARIAATDVRLNTKIDSNLRWILGVQIAMWITIVAAVLL